MGRCGETVAGIFLPLFSFLEMIYWKIYLKEKERNISFAYRQFNT